MQRNNQKKALEAIQAYEAKHEKNGREASAVRKTAEVLRKQEASMVRAYLDSVSEQEAELLKGIIPALPSALQMDSSGKQTILQTLNYVKKLVGGEEESALYTPNAKQK